MVRPATYINGMYPLIGQPAYTELWRCCVGAWHPGLGPTGATILDWSGYKYHGQLANGTAFSVNSGQYSLEFDSVNDTVTVATNPFLSTIGSSDFSYSFWAYLRSQGEGSLGTVCDNYSSTLGGFYILNRGVAGATLAFQAGLSHTTDLTQISANNVFRLNTWDHFAVSFSFSALSFRLFRNGIEISFPTTTTASGTPVSQTRPFILGNRAATDRTFDGFLNDCRMYSRALSPKEVCILATRPGIAYELAPRRRSSVQVAAAFNRRRRLLIGAGS